MQTSTFIYTLECKPEDPSHAIKYYVGSTSQPEVRLHEHFVGNGSEWTKKYKPIRTVDIFKSTSPYDEDNTTKALMESKGIVNVRGGAYCTLELSSSTIATLDRELKSAKGVCYICDKHGHLANNCTATVSSPVTTATKATTKKWSTEDDEKLKSMVQGKEVTKKLVYDLGPEFGRTYAAIAFRLCHLGIISEAKKANILSKVKK